MKLSREWLGEYTTIGAPDKEYCDAMTLSGSKVEGWEVTGSEISRVVVGRVLSMERHTNSDHMWVCKIDVGGERELHVFRVPHDDVDRFERAPGRNRHAVGAARADPHHEELSHHRSLNESSIVTLENATVTPP